MTDKTGATNPAFASEQARLALLFATDRESLVNDLHPGARPTSQLFPESATGFDPALDRSTPTTRTRAKQLLAEAGFPNGFEVNITVLGQPDEDQVAIQSQWARGRHHAELRHGDVDRPVLRRGADHPLLWGPFAVGANPAGFMAGVVYGGFMNTQGATEPEIQAALGAALGATGDAQEQALTDLNPAITSNAWYIPVYEDFTYFGYDAAKVTAPAWAGRTTTWCSPAIKPAAG